MSKHASGSGRHRAREKSEQDIINEMKAKGHAHKAQGEQPGEEFEEKTDRGRKKGFGKNQGDEPVDRSTAFGTRAPGAHHG